MVTIIWGQGLSEDGPGDVRFRGAGTGDAGTTIPTSLLRNWTASLKTGKSVPDDSGVWIVVE